MLTEDLAGIPNCAYHNDVDSVSRCKNCEKYICSNCIELVNGAELCRLCKTQTSVGHVVSKEPKIIISNPYQRSKKSIGGIFVGIVLTLYFIHVSYTAYKSNFWPKVNGHVTESQNRFVLYDYDVNGNTFSAFRIRYGRRGAGAFDSGLDIRYPLNKQVTVYYDPDNPCIAVLEPGLKLGDIISILFGVVVMVIGYIKKVA